MSEGLRERFVTALTATIELYDSILSDQKKEIAQLRRDIADQALEIGRLRQDSKDHARWLHELSKDLPEKPAQEGQEDDH